MPRVSCEGRVFDTRAGERLLDALLDAGIAVPSSCRAGACQSCLVRSLRGTPPLSAQVGLKDALRLQGYFLACVAELTEDIEVSTDAARQLERPARITGVVRASADVLRVFVQPSGDTFRYRAGQFVTLVRGDGLARPYSIASLPGDEGTGGTPPIELHVRVLARGRMSNWLATAGAIGAEVRLRGPAGECFYVEGDPGQPMLLAGAGTGLAPLWGILRDALRAGHTAPIVLWHGARDDSGFYLVDEIVAHACRHPQVDYRRCVLEGTARPGVTVGRLDDLLVAGGSLADSRVFLCGDADLVRAMKRRAFLAGASLKNIHADAFVTAPPAVGAS